MTKLACLAALGATVCAPMLAHADDGNAPGMTAPLTAPVSLSMSSESPKSEHTALALSLGGTTASVALILAGATSDTPVLTTAGVLSGFFTPAMGEWYSGKYLTAGMGIRAVSSLVFVAGAAESFKCFSLAEDPAPCSSRSTGDILMIGGLAGFAGGAIYDIATAKGAARSYNERHGLQLSIAPTPVRGPSGQSTMGLGIGGTF